MQNAVLIVLIIAAFYLAWFVIPRWRMRRAVKQVIKIFERHSATSPSSAKPLKDMGLALQRSLVDTLLRGRDYKGFAIQALMRADVIRDTTDGKFYLLQDKVEQLRFK